MSPLAQATAEILHDANVDEWNMDRFLLWHTSGLILWGANGRLFLQPHGGAPDAFTLWDRFCLWPRVKRMMGLIAARRIVRGR